MNSIPLPAPPLPPGRPRLVVAGFMGTGKSAAGRLAAVELGLQFVDLDDVVARRCGVSIEDLFRRHGEGAFREHERRAVADAARLSGTVIAAGGGAPLHRESFRLLTDGAVATVLTCELGELSQRLAGSSGRPVLQAANGKGPRERIEALLEERRAAYEAAGAPVDTTGLRPHEVAAALAGRYRRGAGEDPVPILVEGPHGAYPVFVGGGEIDAIGHRVAAAVGAEGGAAVVCDAVVRHVAEHVVATLERAGVRVLTLVPLPPGEAAKTIDHVAELWTTFRRSGLGPDSVVVAVGGGAALDAAGFAAATFARGVPLVTVPTTLLAMVDASLGGKTGIDHAGAKNLVGAFHHPWLVVSDPVALEGLPERTLRAGLAEAVKAAALASPLMLEELEAQGPDLSSTSGLTWTVEQAVRIKAAYVAQDPDDRLLRHSLNLGHTFAHAIESAMDHAVPHGEAVAIGMVSAARLGERCHVTPERTAERHAAVLRSLGLPTGPPPGLDAARVSRGLGADKKRRGGRPAFVVPAPGGAALLTDVDEGAALSALFDAGAGGLEGAAAAGVREEDR